MKTAEDITIAQAALTVLKGAGHSLTIEEIYEEIYARKLYEFNTPEPITVLREQVRRHCTGLDRNLTCEPILFSCVKNKSYEVFMHSQLTQRKTQGRRIQRATDKEDLIKALTQTPHAPFKEIWRLLVFAAMLGYRLKRKEILSAVDTGKGIDERYFSNSPSWPGLLHLLALVESEKPEVLSGDPQQDEYRIAVFEQYANGGLTIVKESIESSGYTLDSLCQFIAGVAQDAGIPETALSGIAI